MGSVNDILKTIQSAIEDLANSASAKQDPLYSEVVNLVQKLQTQDGALLNNIANLKIIEQIKTKVERLIIDKKYKDAVKQFASAYDQVAALHNEYFAQFTAKFTPAKTLNILRDNAIETTVNNLTEAGLEAGVTDGIKKILLTNTQTGGSMATLTDQLRNYIITNETGVGALENYTRTYATTAINQFSREYNQQIAADLNLEWYQYTGSLLTTSREFCIKAVAKRYIHESEFPTLLHGDFGDQGKIPVSRTTGLPAGLMEGTTPENFPRRAGGWNCGHQIIAADEITIPQSVKDRVYISPAYKLWAVEHGKDVNRSSSDTTITGVMQKAKEAAPEIETLANNYATRFGGNATPINFKSQSSIQRKVDNELNGDVTLLKDAVRNTVVVPYENLSRVAKALREDPNILRVKMQEGEAYYGYRGIISNIETENGIVGEMQVNSPGMIYAKEPKNIALNYMSEREYNSIAERSGLPGGLGHTYYEEIRNINPATATIDQLERRDLLIELSKKYYANFKDF